MVSIGYGVMTAAVVAFTLSFTPSLITPARASECLAGEIIDNSTAASARKKIESADFQQVQDLTKGCDNYWHGHATKDGAAVNVVLSPQGEVLTEGN